MYDRCYFMLWNIHVFYILLYLSLSPTYYVFPLKLPLYILFLANEAGLSYASAHIFTFPRYKLENTLSYILDKILASVHNYYKLRTMWKMEENLKTIKEGKIQPISLSPKSMS